MNARILWSACISVVVSLSLVRPLAAEDIKRTDLYQRIRKSLDAMPAIDTHDHLRSFDEIPGRDLTDRGRGMTLHSVWAGSYYTWTNPLSAWPEGKSCDVWWAKAKHDFADARATSFYRYLLPAFKDLYGVDFEKMTDDEATRQCLSEALAEKVDRGELSEDLANTIGRQILRDNALKLFPTLKRQLWREKP